MYSKKTTHKKLGFTSLFKKVFILSALLISAFTYAQNSPVVLGNEDYFSTQAFDEQRSGDSDVFKIQFSKTEEHTLKINVKNGDYDGYRIIGNVTSDNKSTELLPIFDIAKENGKINGKIIFQEQKKAYKIWTNDKNEVIIQEENIHDHICVDKHVHKQKTAPLRDISNDTYSKVAPQLESLPGAAHVVYLDFDGEVVSGTGWAGGATINAQSSGFSDQTITQIWRNIAEDLSPFKVNVTTRRAVFDAVANNRRIMAIFTPTDTAAPNTGGVAFLNSFSSNSNNPTWVFNTGDRTAGETGSHEIGHTFGLRHDGQPGVEYYRGHNGWAPIMGTSYSTHQDIGHWSKGEYSNANNTEDDLAIIGNSTNGFGYKTDDHGNGTSSATQIVSDASGNVSASSNGGLIERASDKDVFSFSTSGGNIEFAIDTHIHYPSLNIKARLLNSSGQEVASSDPSSNLSASINTNVESGTYYIEVDGVGDGANPSVGYSDYGSIGNFTISGKYPKGGGGDDTQAPSNPSGLTASNIAQTTLSLSWTASTDNVGVTGYDVYQGNNVIGTATSASYNVTGLTANTAYEFRVKAKDAAGNVSGFSNTTTATTLDDTGTTTYCNSNGQSISDEYISNVQLGSINNASTGSSGGYGDYTTISTSLSKGVSNTITITPTWTGTVYDEAYSVWIDYNQDGDFADSGEQVWTKTASKDTSVSGSFTVPGTATNGNTRMRVSMKYNGIPTPCESFTYGEVEDYTVSIGTGTAPTCNDGIQNGNETGIDCGGSDCEPCTTDSTCTDGIQNGNETGVDCGGPDCEPCSNNGTVVYVDIDDKTVNSSTTWLPFRIESGDEKWFGPWYSGNTLRLVTYGKDVVCEGTSSNITLLGEGVQVGASSNFVANSNSFVVSSSSYTDWNGKSGYIGFNFKINEATHYGWFYATIANDGTSYTILDYAYNTTAGQSLTTSRSNGAEIATGIKIGENSLVAFPNPFNSTINVDVSSIGNEAFTMRVYNVLGQEVYNKRYPSDKNPGIVSFGREFPVGNYYIKTEQLSGKNEVIAIVKASN